MEKEILGRLEPVTGLSFTDPFEARRIGYFLWRLRDAGKIGEREFQDTAYQQSGPAWDKARQMATMDRAFPNLMTFLLGPSAKLYGKHDMQIDAMWNAWSNIWDARANLPYDQWRRMFDAFDVQYPFGRSVMLARELDPDERMKDYAYMLLDRLPPGTARYDALKTAGLSDDLMDKFYTTKGDVAQWTPEEVTAFRVGLDKLAAAYDIPTPDQVLEFAQAKQQHEYRASMALAKLATQGYALSRDQLNKVQGDYFALPEGTPRQTYLAQHPELKLYWDAVRAQERERIPGEGVAGAPGMRTPNLAPGIEDTYWPPSINERVFRNLPPGSRWRDGLTLPPLVADALDPAKRAKFTPEQAKQVEDWLAANLPKQYANPAEWEIAKQLEAQYTAEAKRRFGADIEMWASEYGALKGNDAARAAYRNADPERYAALKRYWDFKDKFGELNPAWGKYYGFAPDSGSGYSSAGRSYSSSRRYTSSRRSYSSSRRSYSSSRRSYSSGKSYGITYPVIPSAPAVPAAPPAWQTRPLIEFSTALAALRKTNPQLDSAIEKLFGPGALALALDFFALGDAARKAWLADPKNAHLLALLMRFMAWFEGQQTRTTDFASRILGSVPANAYRPPTIPPLVAPQLASGVQ